MTLDDLLYMFKKPTDAAKLAGLGRTSAYHWYASGSKRLIPPPRTLILFADHFKLTDAELGSVMRDGERIRSRRPMVLKKRKRKKKAAAVNWTAKEQYLKSLLDSEEVRPPSADILDRLTRIMKEHL